MSIIMVVIQEIAHLSNTAVLYYNNLNDAIDCVNDLPAGWMFKAIESIQWDIMAD